MADRIIGRQILRTGNRAFKAYYFSSVMVGDLESPFDVETPSALQAVFPEHFGLVGIAMIYRFDHEGEDQLFHDVAVPVRGDDVVNTSFRSIVGDDVIEKSGVFCDRQFEIFDREIRAFKASLNLVAMITDQEKYLYRWPELSSETADKSSKFLGPFTDTGELLEVIS